jgi:hypothetical protein
LEDKSIVAHSSPPHTSLSTGLLTLIYHKPLANQLLY